MIDTFKIERRKIPVKISIKGLLGLMECNFIVDTGASHSIINSDLLRTIGYYKKHEYKKEMLTGFAGHSIDVPFLKVKSFMCLGLTRRNFDLGFIEFRSTIFYDGILGIDFFLNHKLILDLKHGIIELE